MVNVSLRQIVLSVIVNRVIVVSIVTSSKIRAKIIRARIGVSVPSTKARFIVGVMHGGKADVVKKECACHLNHSPNACYRSHFGSD